jgi:hypothetical protein
MLLVVTTLVVVWALYANLPGSFAEPSKAENLRYSFPEGEL